MAVKNAEEASEIVRQFLARMGADVLSAPKRAERSNQHWIVEFIVSFRVMRFELDAETGEIVRYQTVE